MINLFVKQDIWHHIMNCFVELVTYYILLNLGMIISLIGFIKSQVMFVCIWWDKVHSLIVTNCDG